MNTQLCTGKNKLYFLNLPHFSLKYNLNEKIVYENKRTIRFMNYFNKSNLFNYIIYQLNIIKFV